MLTPTGVYPPLVSPLWVYPPPLSCCLQTLNSLAGHGHGWVAECTRRGMKIILDYHRIRASLASEGAVVGRGVPRRPGSTTGCCWPRDQGGTPPSSG